MLRMPGRHRPRHSILSCPPPPLGGGAESETIRVGLEEVDRIAAARREAADAVLRLAGRSDEERRRLLDVYLSARADAVMKRGDRPPEGPREREVYRSGYRSGIRFLRGGYLDPDPAELDDGWGEGDPPEGIR